MLPCLRPCTRKLSCNHKCRRNCTDKCACAESCDRFLTSQAGEHKPELRLNGNDPNPNSPGKNWRVFSRNPKVHDDEIRQTKIKEMAEQNAQDQLSRQLGIPATTSNSSVSMDIQERFIPIQSHDGRRMTGKTHDIAQTCGNTQLDGRSKKQTHQNEIQHTRQSGHSQQSALRSNRRKNEPPQQQPQAHTGPRNVQQTGSQQQRTQHTQAQRSLGHHSVHIASTDGLHNAKQTVQGTGPSQGSDNSGSEYDGYLAEVVEGN